MAPETATGKKCNQDGLFEQFEVFERYQIFQYILINLPIFFVAMVNVNYIFVAANIAYRCRIPECDGANASLEVPSWWPENAESQCTRPVMNYTRLGELNQTCDESVFVLENEICQEFLYENDHTIVAGLNLGCQTWKANLVGTTHNAGMMISMILMGYISDRFGRKASMILCSVGGCIGLLKTIVNNYTAYLVIEFSEALLSSGIYTIGVVLMIEIGGDSKRVVAGVIFSGMIYLGETVFAMVAMGLQHWKPLILATYFPLFSFISYIFILEESTRWQMTRNRMSEAKENLKTIARINKLNISATEIDSVDDEILSSKFNVDVKTEKETIMDMLRSKEIMIRLAVTCVCFFTGCLVYFGLAIHSVSLPGNKYTNFALGALLAFPGDLLTLYAFNKFGRRISLQLGFVCCALCIIAHAYIPESLAWLKIFLFLLGKLNISLCFTGIYTYSVELAPTSVRGSMVGCGNMVARIGSMLSPLTPLLSSIYEPLPSLVLAAATLLTSGFLFFIPDTKGVPMMDTIAQAEAYKKKTSGNKPI